MMRVGRLAMGLVLLAAASGALVVACSDAAPPPLVQSYKDAGVSEPYDAGTPVPPSPCSPPKEGCPCADAGDQLYCGLIYRRAGDIIDCSKGYMTCLDTGEWGPCEGPMVWTGD